MKFPFLVSKLFTMYNFKIPLKYEEKSFFKMSAGCLKLNSCNGR